MALTRDVDTIRHFITTQFLFEFDDTVTEHSNLFELGLIDSYGFIELVKFVESEFQIVFTDEEIIANTLSTLAGIENAVRIKSHARP